ncbi:MAG: hypothetical protein AAGF11_56490 [Myxococcota bacterium]
MVKSAETIAPEPDLKSVETSASELALKSAETFALPSSMAKSAETIALELDGEID